MNVWLCDVCRTERPSSDAPWFNLNRPSGGTVEGSMGLMLERDMWQFCSTQCLASFAAMEAVNK